MVLALRRAIDLTRKISNQQSYHSDWLIFITFCNYKSNINLEVCVCSRKRNNNTIKY